MGSPKNPSGSFQHSVTKYNANRTSLVSNNENQIKSYINYRLNEWDLYNSNKGKNISRIDIANAANWLIDDSRTEQEIKKHFAGKETLLHMALYAIDNRLNSCFGDGVSSPGNCFVKWRDTHADYFKNISDEFQRYATPISMADAEFFAANDAQIKFLVDSNGDIDGATITENGDTTEYTAWAHFSRDDKYFMLDKVDYNSVGKTLGLSYSDFGTYSIEREKYDMETKEESTETILANVPLAGGYASHKIEKSDIANDVLFSGQAVGNARDSQHRVDLSGTATLTFDKESGTSTLYASFDNWYNIQVADNESIRFSNYTNKNNLVKLNATPDSDGVITDTDAKMDVGYYAPVPDKGVPTEATGLVQYTETASGVKMDIAFGAK